MSKKTNSTSPDLPKKTSGNPRRKGHNFERMIAKYLKSHLGHDVRTTREASRTLDNCGIDLVNTDALIQCKAGYDTRRPKYEELHNYIKSNISNHFTPDHHIHKYPVYLIHNIDVGKGHKRGPEHTTVTMTLEDYINIRIGNTLPILQIL